MVSHENQQCCNQIMSQDNEIKKSNKRKLKTTEYKVRCSLIDHTYLEVESGQAYEKNVIQTKTK